MVWCGQWWYGVVVVWAVVVWCGRGVGSGGVVVVVWCGALVFMVWCGGGGVVWCGVVWRVNVYEVNIYGETIRGINCPLSGSCVGFMQG